MGTLIVVDCEAPFGVGAPSVGDMTEFGAVDFNALRRAHRDLPRHGLLEETFGKFREWLEPRKPVVFVSDNPAYDFQWINFYFWRYFGENPFGHSGRRIADFYAGLVGDFRSTRSGSDRGGPNTIIIRSTTRSAMPRRSSGCSTEREVSDAEFAPTRQMRIVALWRPARNSFQTSHRAISDRGR
ncbi:MAG: hypothetical protein U0163_20235 [Gemmatimonadaceae bacterium]